VVVVFNGQGQYVFSTATVVTLATGDYQAIFTIPSGSAGTLCGSYSVSGYILASGGLTGSYFTNKWFSGDAYQTQVDTQVNFSWGSDDIITDVASNYVSITWEGFVLPAFTEAYTFSVESNDGIRLYVNEELLIDELSDVANDASSHILSSSTVSLTASEFASIKVQYYDATGAAFVSVFWESASLTKEVIPSANLYYKFDSVPIGGESAPLELESVPYKPTDLVQSDDSTYAATTVTLEWSAPSDYGCSAITSYTIQKFDGGSWVDSTTLIATTSGTTDALTSGVSIPLRVLAVNAIGDGTESDDGDFIPSDLPNASATITVSAYGSDYLDLDWA
jgi:hypothetical protein